MGEMGIPKKISIGCRFQYLYRCISSNSFQQDHTTKKPGSGPEGKYLGQNVCIFQSPCYEGDQKNIL